MIPSNKIVTLETLANLANDLKKDHQKIIHCHGVFDLLHIGHIHYFEEAKSMGDCLIVTLTQDNYVNKGPYRPKFTELQRAQAIAALSCVDYVAINKWPTAIETIHLIKPTIYVKGPDYKQAENDHTGNILKEKKAIEENGGQLKYTSTELFSSSNLINTYLSSLTEQQTNYIII